MTSLAKMFELRNWYIQNSPHTIYSQKYTSEMAYLHNEMNYINSKQMLFRALLSGAVILGYAVFIMD
jgi:hypothetical protein